MAGALASERGWDGKIARLLDLADLAPPQGPGRTLAFRVLEQPLGEILGSRAGVAALVGEAAPDLGAGLAMITRLVAPQAVAALMQADPVLGRQFPSLDSRVERLARWLADPAFGGVRAALARRVLDELGGPRRLRPDDPAGEIQAMRAMARVLVVAGPEVASPEDVHAAFLARSKSLLTDSFVQIYLQAAGAPLGDAQPMVKLGDAQPMVKLGDAQPMVKLVEAQALVKLGENVVGGANKRAAAKWLKSAVFALRFERELVQAAESCAVKLAHLADLAHALGRMGLAEEDRAEIARKLGDIGALLEAEARLVHAIAHAPASAAHRLLLLLKMAAGEIAPQGPVCARARAEALRLARDPASRTELAKTPELVARVHDLIAAA